MIIKIPNALNTCRKELENREGLDFVAHKHNVK